MTESNNQNLIAWDAIAHILTAHISAMGREQMIGPDVVTNLTGAIARVREQAVAGEDIIELVRDFDARLEAQVQPDVASAGRTGRSPVDVSAAVARLEALSLLRTLDAYLGRCETALIVLAEQNYPVLMPVTMDGFVSQPTSVAHWLGAVIEQIGRARDAILFAYDLTDRSPLGSSALASSGFAVDRARLARGLGFNGAIESTFDAVASIDWVSTCANAIDGALMPLQRFSNEIFTWFRIEPVAFRIGDWLMESASGIPQWNGPYGLVRLNTDLVDFAFQAHILAQ